MELISGKRHSKKELDKEAFGYKLERPLGESITYHARFPSILMRYPRGRFRGSQVSWTIFKMSLRRSMRGIFRKMKQPLSSFQW
jgi:hypothetical protein